MHHGEPARLAVAGVVTAADGTAERSAAQLMLKAKRKTMRHRITVGADKAYDTKDHVAALRVLDVTPHVAQNQSLTKKPASAAKRARRAHNTARELWPIAEAPQDDRVHLRLGQAARRDAQG